jgi:NTP pyrophosphatase (non-canonical NTP hydrolase)
MTSEEILAAAWEKWGAHAQLMQLAEECCELAHACHKYVRAAGTTDAATAIKVYENLKEEAVDVQLMLDQIRYGIIHPDGWTDMMKRKLARVAALLVVN